MLEYPAFALKDSSKFAGAATWTLPVRLVPVIVNCWRLGLADGEPWHAAMLPLTELVVKVVGLTLILNVMELPLHDVVDGVTVIVATITVCPLLMAVNDGMSPVPVAGRPIAGLSFVQV
jgi:hypothetical protein